MPGERPRIEQQTQRFVQVCSANLDEVCGRNSDTHYAPGKDRPKAVTVMQAYRMEKREKVKSCKLQLPNEIGCTLIGSARNCLRTIRTRGAIRAPLRKSSDSELLRERKKAHNSVRSGREESGRD